MGPERGRNSMLGQFSSEEEFPSFVAMRPEGAEWAEPCLPPAPSPVLGGFRLNDRQLGQCSCPAVVITGSHSLPAVRRASGEREGGCVLSPGRGSRSRAWPVCAPRRGHLSREAFGREPGAPAGCREGPGVDSRASEDVPAPWKEVTLPFCRGARGVANEPERLSSLTVGVFFIRTRHGNQVQDLNAASGLWTAEKVLEGRSALGQWGGSEPCLGVAFPRVAESGRPAVARERPSRS